MTNRAALVPYGRKERKKEKPKGDLLSVMCMSAAKWTVSDFCKIRMKTDVSPEVHQAMVWLADCYWYGYCNTMPIL